MKILFKIIKLLKAYNTHCNNEAYYQFHGDYIEASIEDEMKYDVWIQLRELEFLHRRRFAIAQIIVGGRIDKTLSVSDK
tara:strand:+ start:737 stop:973 length:237 start_codon:yes stop_codon:yes gene_type:complete